MQSMPGPWRRNPKPDAAVTKLADTVHEAAGSGQIRLMAVVTINPMLEAEVELAGDLDNVKRDLLIGALTRLILKISE